MDQSKAIDRVRKLLRLAENAGSEEEAALAASRAADLDRAAYAALDHWWSASGNAFAAKLLTGRSNT